MLANSDGEGLVAFTSGEAELHRLESAMRDMRLEAERAVVDGGKVWLRLNVLIDQHAVRSVSLVRDKSYELDGVPPKR